MTYKLGDGENATQIAKYKYSYDANGNVTRVEADGELIAKYQYDSLNQLKVAWDYQQLLKFYYNYDNSGNIESSTYQSLMAGYEDYVTGNPHSANYYYRDSDWGDLLTEYKGTTLSYDNIGNPTNYRDGMTMSWSGRELKSLNKSGKTYNFTYNLDGLRTKREKKQGDTVLETVNYYYDDSNNLIGLKKDNTTVLFYYDSEGKVYSMTKGDDTYFFIKNLQGDVTKIIDENGDTCATYAYDAWGALLAENEDSSIEGLNPFRYRGYVYDTETQLYYLQSRYYDPKTGRFINADDSAYTDTYSGSPLSTNMFAYCENNYIMGIDRSGNNAKKKNLEEYLKSRWGKSSFGDNDKKIKLKVNNNKIRITAYVNITGKLKDQKIVYNNKKVKYKTLIKKGIEKLWNGKFKLFNYYKVSLTTSIKNRENKAIKIKTFNKRGVSHCTNPCIWLVGDYRDVYIYKGDSRDNKDYTAKEFLRVAAHEFGHVLGLDDLYTKSSEVKEKYCCSRTRKSLMCGHWGVKSINGFDLKGVIKAFAKNRPYRWE